MKQFDNFIQHKGIKGGEGVPNSLESIVKNYKGRIECDVYLLRDGNIAIIHEQDFNLKREDVEKLDLKGLEALRLASAGREITPPLLKEFIGLAEDADTSLSLEIRSGSKEGSLILAHNVINQFLEMDKAGGASHDVKFIEDKVTFESFSVEVLNKIKKIGQENNKNLKTALYWPSDEIWARKINDFDWPELDKVKNKEGLSWSELGIEVASNNDINSLELQSLNITKELVERAHNLNLKIGSSPTDDEELMKKLIDYGVDYILTTK